MIGEWDIHGADDLVMCLVDFSGHVGRHFDGVHRWYDVGQGYLGGGNLQILPEEKNY